MGVLRKGSSGPPCRGLGVGEQIYGDLEAVDVHERVLKVWFGFRSPAIRASVVSTCVTESFVFQDAERCDQGGHGGCEDTLEAGEGCPHAAAA